MKKLTTLLFIILSAAALSAKKTIVEPSYAWNILPPLGLREPATIDTLFQNYAQRFVPSMVTPAYATTGNYGAEGETLLFFERKPASDFFFRDALSAWLPSVEKMTFYNTRIPMTLLSYNFGGGKETAQDRLKADFSGNINSRAQVGALVDYLYSKGSYNYQAVKSLTWGFSGSYIGERYQFQGFYYHYNHVNKENGGITDDLYITDPAEIQGGSSSVDTKSIPTFLNNAHNRLVGGQLYLNNRYNLGFYDEVETEDSVVTKFVPVSSFTWTLDYQQSRHSFKNANSTQNLEYWENTYLDAAATNDRTSYWSLRNTFGVSLLEGFNKYAKAGLSAYLTHEYRKFMQLADTLDRTIELPANLSPLPVSAPPTSKGENLMWVGAQLTKQQGRLLNYEATATLGFMGEAAGEIKVDGNISTHFKLLKDSVTLQAYGHFNNTAVPYLLKHYISNHFVWDNDFGKIRSFRVGGELKLDRTNTRLNIGVENIQNQVYFNAESLPTQNSSSVQVFSATLNQNFKLGVLHWNNSITYQTSSDDVTIPLPKLAIYSNLYLLFRVATLHVQLGVDCDYYTKYKSVAYQPATMTFYNQREIDCGNYPLMNVYANMKLSKTRFYLMYSHVNQGWFGNNSFSMPHYPINPSRFQLGLSVDFAN